MDRLTLFRYFPGNSPFQRIDARIKTASLLLVSFVIFRTTLPGSILLIIGFISLFAVCRTPPRYFLPLLWPFSPLFAVIILTKFLLSDDLSGGVILVIRMITLILLGVFYTGTTTFEEIRKSISWFLKPLPGEAGFTISTMVGITLSFIPLIFIQSRKIQEAHISRNIGASGRPFRRIKHFALQAIIGTLEIGDQIGEAMESRCYNSRRSLCFPPVRAASWIFLAIAAVVVLAGVLLPHLTSRQLYTF